MESGLLRFALFFASGDSLYAGVALLWLVCLLLVKCWCQSRWSRIGLRFLWLTGLGLCVLATVPMPIWLAVVSGLLVILVSIRVSRPYRPANTRRDRWILNGMVIVSGLICLGELRRVADGPPWRPDVDGVIVVGDSLSAADTDPKLTAWPELLGGPDFQITNVARMGATAGSAIRQLEGFNPAYHLVLLLIRGNDLLGTTSVEDFEKNLEQLVQAAKNTGRGTQVVMFELPLPPFCWKWGAAQRRVAYRNGVPMFPKRVLASVLGADGATLDGIHLSQTGHALMARAVGAMLSK